jgi:hypothetical protein
MPEDLIVHETEKALLDDADLKELLALSPPRLTPIEILEEEAVTLQDGE